MTEIKPEQHHCWVKTCKCGHVNRGCVRVGVKCYGCGSLLDFSDYPNLSGLTVKPIIITQPILQT